MSPQVETSSKSFADTLAFVEKASAIPLQRKPAVTGAFYPPKDAWQSDVIYRRNWEVTGRYLGTAETLEEIGVPVVLTGERVRQIVKRTVRTLHKRASNSVRTGVYLKNLDLRKPLTTESPREGSNAGSNISARFDNPQK